VAAIIITIIAPAKIGLFVFVAELFTELNVQHNEITGFPLTHLQQLIKVYSKLFSVPAS